MSLSSLMQKLIMSNPDWADAFQTRMPTTFFTKKGQAQALQTFQTAARRVPAYQDFLQKHGVRPEQIKTWSDFQKLPVSDKKSYLRQYPLRDLCLDGDLTQMYTLSVSSGSTGEPFFWPMAAAQTALVPSIIELIYRKFFQIHQKSTLMLITLALGTWVAGELAAEASRAVARKSQYKLTVATPGLNLEETLKLIQKLATFYQQTVLVGYPPFIKDLLEKGSNRGLDWPSLTIKVLTGGEGHSENWRNWVMDKIGSKNPQDILNLFGLAEAGILGFETPLTVHLRRKAHADQQLSQALFGTSQSLPSLMQYNPLARFLEEKDGELLLTANLGLPLVRYNLHDRGRLIALKSLPAGYLENPHWQIPLFCVFGRSDAATLYGVNIYTDNVQAGLEDPGLAETNTGQFKMKTVFDRDQNQALQVAVELKSQAPLSKELEQRYTQVLTETLRQKNSEYSRLYQEKKTQVEPRVKLIESGTQEFAEPVSVKRKYLDST